MPEPVHHQCRSCCHIIQRKLSNISCVYRCIAFPEHPKPVLRYDWACRYWCQRMTPGQIEWLRKQLLKQQAQDAHDAGLDKGEATYGD